MNSTSAMKESPSARNKMIVSVVFILVIGFLLLFFYLSKSYKQRRESNQSFLFETLLMSDACYLFLSLPLVFSVNNGKLGVILRLIFGCMVNTVTLISMEMYIFLSLDIFIAVKYSLQYAIVFPLPRVKLIVSRVFSVTIFFSILLHVEPPTRQFSRNTRVGFDIITIIFRFVTSFTMQTLGLITKSARNKQKNELERKSRVFGENAEKLFTIRGLRRQVKDMAILNTWNSLFLIPLGFCTIIHLVDFQESISGLDISLRVIHSTLGPIVTVFSQSSYRKFLKKMFTPNNVVSNNPTL